MEFSAEKLDKYVPRGQTFVCSTVRAACQRRGLGPLRRFFHNPSVVAPCWLGLVKSGSGDVSSIALEYDAHPFLTGSGYLKLLVLSGTCVTNAGLRNPQ